jgi:hypothetical protein
MTQFEGVTVVKAANVYRDGKVTSRTVLFANGDKKTLGIIQPGDYEEYEGDREIMEILSGELEVKLPGSDVWQTITGGQSFEVPANAKFHLRAKTLTDYCCSYLK